MFVHFVSLWKGLAYQICSCWGSSGLCAGLLRARRSLEGPPRFGLQADPAAAGPEPPLPGLGGPGLVLPLLELPLEVLVLQLGLGALTAVPVLQRRLARPGRKGIMRMRYNID